MRCSARTVSVVAAGFLVGACDHAVDTAMTEAQAGNRTIVVLGSGAPKVQVVNVSEDQREAELKERQALVSGSPSAT